MKRIEELQKVKGDAYDYYVSPNQDNDLFEKIFLVGDIVEEIEDLDKFFLIGEKGSGKTAYAVYMSKIENGNSSCKLALVENTLYQRFLHMKEQKSLELSSIKDIWINLLYLMLAEHIQENKDAKSIWEQLKYKQLINAINAFYSDSFKPELVNAMEFLDKASVSINAMVEQGLFSNDFGITKEKSKKYVEQSYQVSLMKIRNGFEQAFEKISLDKEMILFIDGIDGRPADIDSKQYFECLTGLVNAVIEINQSVLCKKNMKVMLLMRPDIMYKMPIHNLNQKLRENSVLLDWVTTYKDYVKSNLFKIADDYFAKQQDKAYELAECWNYYFPYKIHYKNSRPSDNPFVEFLRYSLYKPRDILTMLNELADATSGEHFEHQDFKNMLSNYSDYLKGELKDYMLIYMSDVDYANFLIFFDYFAGHREFDYEYFVEKHTAYIKYLNEIGRTVPPYMATAGEALQLLYDSNIICYKITKEGKKFPKMYWSYKERSYANMQPEVKKNGEYAFHMAYASAFRLFE